MPPPNRSARTGSVVAGLPILVAIIGLAAGTGRVLLIASVGV
jgi:hypothetical protein